LALCDISNLAGIVFSGLSSLVIEDVSDRDGVIVVEARTAGGPVPCPRCAGLTGQVYGYCGRTVADVPADGRPVVVQVRVRRMRCGDLGCPVQTFRRALPGAVQAGDRWHLWHSLGEAVLKEVAAHSACWAAAGPPLNEGKQAKTTAERWRQVHDLTDRGTGLLECSRRLGLSLNTVKRYARAAEPGRMIRAPRYRATLVDPYSDHLRARRAADPAVPVHQLLAEIREQGYPGSMNLLYRYITQGRVEADRPHLSPRRVTRMLLTRPEALSASQQALLSKLTGACLEMTSLAGLVRDFAALLTPDPANEIMLRNWAQAARAADLPSLHAFTRGLDLDAQAVIAAVTLPFHNGRTEGVNTKTKMMSSSRGRFSPRLSQNRT
jgi:transposase